MKRRIKEGYYKREGRGHYIVPLLLFFILFPLAMSNFSDVERQTIAYEEEPGQVWVMEEQLWGKKKIALEEYLIGMLAATIPVEYELETLKAQAIILRSFCLSRMKKEDGMKVVHDEIIKDYYWNDPQRKEVWQEKQTENETKIRQAVKETKGLILVCNGDIINPPFFRLSNGNTRDIEEYVYTEDRYPFMKSVACKQDMLAEDYIQYVEMNHKEFEKELKTFLPKGTGNIRKMTSYKDEKGYVKEVEINGVKIEGEKFRKLLGLASSSFTLQKIDSVIEIQTKGIGHGFGFSQWSANNMALEGAMYEELLHFFYENITLEKI